MKKQGIYILPINEKVIFPYQTIKIKLNENHQYSIKAYNNLIGLVTQFPDIQSDSKDKGNNTQKNQKLNYNKDELLSLNNMSLYGSLIKIYSTISSSYTLKSQNRGSESRQDFSNISAVVINRFKVLNYTKQENHWIADVEIFSDEIHQNIEKQLLKDNNFIKLKSLALDYYKTAFSPEIYQSKRGALESEQNIVKAVFQIAGTIDMKYQQKLMILQQDEMNKRIELLLKFLQDILNDKNIMEELKQKVNEQIRQETRQLYLKKQLGEINKQLYGKDEDEFEELKQKIEKAQLPDEIRTAIQKEFARLKKMSGQNADASVLRNYIETALDLPWQTSTIDQNDLKRAEEVLDRDHSGLEKVKKRILEFLAVRKLKGNSKGSILCLHGPPGVGKTSLGKSVAEALNRKFSRIALGGVRDEAEIRGHRRTYVGALPGVFISTLKKCSSNNPVILLDEIDKLTRDHRGDPSSALLEVLDPSQNHTFTDHYLQLPFDLSNVLFIATCNSLETIQPALLDRLEIISIPGYTKKEKFEIATKYLIPKQVQENGLLQDHIKFNYKAVNLVIDGYTREAGVRNLERNIGAICRNVAVQLTKFQENISDQVFTQVIINPDKVEEILGQVLYDEDLRDRITVPGISIGMAWTASGGKILYVETSKSRGKGRVQITGKLGDVMKESVMTAIGWIKENISQLDIDKDSIIGAEQLLSRQKNQYIQNCDKNGFDQKNLVEVQTELEFVSNIFDYLDIHVHFPAASTPKDGPSAGITILTALVSLLTSRKVRSDVSMTGEVTLKGIVLPVGGVKEKCLAAHANGIKRIILPFKNKKDVDEIQKEIKEKIQFYFVKTIDEVLDLALEKKKFVNDKLANNLLLERIRLEQQNKILKKSKL